MRFLVQRVKSASVAVESSVVGSIESGLLVFVGVGHGDTPAIAEKMVGKLLGLRIFEDSDGKMNCSVADEATASADLAGILVISQFTLYADCRKGRRPSFTDAASPDVARSLLDHVVNTVRERQVPVAVGQFGAHMQVKLVNDGPVTIWLDSDVLFPADR